MTVTGHSDTNLIVLRGNSGAGKSTTARLVRAGLREGLVDVHRGYYRNNVALIEQDYVRRILLGEHDHPDGINIRLIDQAARIALDGGFDVIIEGMLFADRYAEMLTALTRDHRGVTHHWYFDASLTVTQQRHLHRAESAQVPVSKLAEWYREDDLLPGMVQRVMKSSWTPPEAAAAIIGAARTGPGGEPNRRTVR